MRHLWIALALLVGCKTNAPEETTTPSAEPAPSSAPATPAESATPTGAAAPTEPSSPTEPDAAGCTLAPIYFAADGYEPTAGGAAALGRAATCIQGLGDVQVYLEGHADERKGEEESLAIAERYASHVRDALIANGIARERIHTISFGRERPSCMEHTDECRAENRRCELRTE